MRYIKLEAAYKFKPDGNTYKQTHYRGVAPEECFRTVHSQLLHLFSNVFDKVVFLESIRTTEISQLEYEAGSWLR